MKIKIIRNINRKQFLIRYMILNLPVTIFMFKYFLEISIVIKLLSTIFLPIIILTCEGVIIIGRLNDIGRSSELAIPVLFLKFQVMVRSLLSVYQIMPLYSPISLILMIAYLISISILCIHKTSENLHKNDLTEI